MNFYALDSETGRLMMIDLTECNDGFQPTGVRHGLKFYDWLRPTDEVHLSRKRVLKC